MLSVALQSKSTSPHILEPIPVTERPVSPGGNGTNNVYIRTSSPLPSTSEATDGGSPKRDKVVMTCVHCSTKFYARYPSSMHISTYCSKGESHILIFKNCTC